VAVANSIYFLVIHRAVQFLNVDFIAYYFTEFISSSSLMVKTLRFNKCRIISLANSNNLASSFPNVYISFLSLA
jgi:hypothetical protein